MRLMRDPRRDREAAGSSVEGASASRSDDQSTNTLFQKPIPCQGEFLGNLEKGLLVQAMLPVSRARSYSSPARSQGQTVAFDERTGVLCPSESNSPPTPGTTSTWMPGSTVELFAGVIDLRVVSTDLNAQQVCSRRGRRRRRHRRKRARPDEARTSPHFCRRPAPPHLGRSDRWLRRQGFPAGFQVLSQYRNIGRALNGGVCPHQTRALVKPSRK